MKRSQSTMLPGIERGPNHLVHVLRAAGEVEQQFGARLNIGARGIEQDFADLLADGGSAGLDRFDHVLPMVAQPLGEHAELRGLAATVDAFECNERPRCTGFSLHVRQCHHRSQ